jgi:hypothetical protein
MSEIPTYEELEQRIRELEEAESERKRVLPIFFLVQKSSNIFSISKSEIPVPVSETVKTT